jgi:amino-acid N-acetyltransferase
LEETVKKPDAAAVSVRRAEERDLPTVIGLLRSANLPLEGVDLRLVEGMCVAYANGKLVGCAAVESAPPFGLLRSVAVAEPWRGAGFGARLVRNRLAWAASQRLERLYLLTTTAPGFFAGLGFSEIVRQDVPSEVRDTVEFSAACPETAVVMACWLGSHRAGAGSTT